MCFSSRYFSPILGPTTLGIFQSTSLKINCANLWEHFPIATCVCLFFYLHEEITITDMRPGKENSE